MTRNVLMQGSEALVRGAIYAGVKFFAGYPITPATETSEHMSRLLPKAGGIYFQGEDELASVNAIIGASWAGLKVMTATSGPGFSLMQEGIGYAVVTETPMVVVDVQRGGPSTGQPTLASQQDVMQAKFGTHGDYEIIALAPSNVEEMFTLTVKAVNFAESYRTPVVLLADEIVAHIWEKARIPESGEIPLVDRKKPPTSPGTFRTFQPDDDLIPPMPKLCEGFKVLVEGSLHDESGLGVGNNPEKSSQLVYRLIEKIQKHEQEISMLEYGFLDDGPEAVIISYGSVSRSAYEAARIIRMKGLRIGYVRLISLWPFPEKALGKILENVKMIFFPEMNIGKYSNFIKILGVPVTSIPKIGGEMHTPQEIIQVAEKWRL
jgi:2-oxoglutarate ferredoxin oxidoreductase subunit alpha